MKTWLALLAATTPAWAGGSMLPIRGVRALERGGAFVAGADDADALWSDPAGLAHGDAVGTKSFLFDLALVIQPVTYSRVDSSGMPLAPVSNEQPTTPIPTLAASLAVADRLVIAAGIASPYAPLHRYEDSGAQRYASVSWSGSTLVIATLGAAYRVGDRLRVGATLQDLVSSLDAKIVMSMCADATSCGAEDKDFDALAEVQQQDHFAPSASIGVQYDAIDALTLGLAVQAPTQVSSRGTLTMRLPTNTLFTTATVAGDRVSMRFALPPSLRAGVEYHTSALRVEAAVDVELWSIHDEIAIEPEDVRIDNVQGVGTYTLGPMTIPRHYKTSIAPSLGAEYHAGSAMVGAGIAYETAAAPAAYVSVLTVDAPKVLVGFGGGYDSDGWQLGGALGYGRVATVALSIDQAKVTQLDPIRTAPDNVFINAGTYRTSYWIAGLRAARRF